MQVKQFWLGTLYWSDDVAKFCGNDGGHSQTKQWLGSDKFVGEGKKMTLIQTFYPAVRFHITPIFKPLSISDWAYNI